MFFEDFFGGPGGMPGGHGPHSRGGGDVDTEAFYEELGVSKNATEREIKKAWRKLARTHHPDRGGDPELFKKKEAAYDVLSNPEKRKLYDQGGIEAVQQGGVPGSNIADLFGFGGRRQRDTGPKKPAPIKEIFTITLEDVYRGGERKLPVTIRVADEVEVCEVCHGRGRYMETVRRGPMIMQTQRECPSCDGRGKAYKNERKVRKQLEFYIPTGVKNGDKQTLHDEGHQLPDMPRGDVVVQFQVKKHPIYKRMGADLAMAKELTLVQALCGFEFLVKGLEEETFFKISGKKGQVVQHGDVIKIKEYGLPQRGGSSNRGNLYVRFSVVLPKSGSLSDGDKKTISQVLGGKKVTYDMPKQDVNDTREIEKGTRVRLTGLNNRPDLNEMPGIVIQANIKPGSNVIQHAVQLESGPTVSVREELLEILGDPNEESNKPYTFKVGMKVKLTGLQNNTDLNGTRGVIMELDVKPGAHAVSLSNGKVVSILSHYLEPIETKNKKNKKRKSVQGNKPRKDDHVVELEGEVIDMDKEVHTSAGIHQHDDDDEREQEGVGCRQM